MDAGREDVTLLGGDAAVTNGSLGDGFGTTQQTTGRMRMTEVSNGETRDREPAGSGRREG